MTVTLEAPQVPMQDLPDLSAGLTLADAAPFPQEPIWTALVAELGDPRALPPVPCALPFHLAGGCVDRLDESGVQQ